MLFRMLISALLLVAISVKAHAVEEPDFDLVEKEDAFEIRDYAPMIVAQVEITGDMRRAGQSGFYPLFRYISGDNAGRNKIDMTAPVTRQPVKIDMTAPVIRSGDDDGVWSTAFVMPSEWTMETLPAPSNPNVSLRELPGELVAVVKFNGVGRQSKYLDKQAALEDWLAERGYTIAGPARYAGYDAPMTPPIFRRNEVMIPVVRD